MSELDWIDQDKLIDMKALLDEYKEETAAAALTGVGLAGIKGTADALGNRTRIAAYPHNFLKGFYGKLLGGGMVDQAVATGREAGLSGIQIMRDIVDPRTSYAYKKTGLSTRGFNELYNLQGDIDNLRNNMQINQNYEAELLKGKNDINTENLLKKNHTEHTKLRKQLASVQKKQHYKLINDYSNRFLFNDNPAVTDDVARYGKQFVTKLNGPTDAIKYFGNSRQAMEWIVGAHKVKNLDNARYLLHTMPPKTGDVLRGIQFERKVFNLFGKMNELDSFDNLTRKKVIGMAKNVGLSFNDKLSTDKLFFKVSPAMKANYDWGGYQGIIEWNRKNKGVVKFYATDQRDLFGIGGKQLGGRDVINVAQPKTVKIPEVITKISDDLPAKRVKEIKEVIEKHPKAKELKPLIANNYSPGNNIGHDRQIQRIVNRHKRMLNFNPLNKKLLNPKWLLRHGSIGLTVAGSLALGGFLAKNIYDIAKR